MVTTKQAVIGSLAIAALAGTGGYVIPKAFEKAEKPIEIVKIVDGEDGLGAPDNGSAGKSDKDKKGAETPEAKSDEQAPEAKADEKAEAPKVLSPAELEAAADENIRAAEAQKAKAAGIRDARVAKAAEEQLAAAEKLAAARKAKADSLPKIVLTPNQVMIAELGRTVTNIRVDYIANLEANNAIDLEAMKNPDLTEYRAQLTERIALYNQAGGIYTTQLKTLYQEKRRVEAEQAARAAGVETTNDIGNVLTEETEGGAEKAKQNRDALRGRFHDAKTIDADVQDEPAAEPEAEAEPEARAYSDFAIPVYAVLNSSNRSFEAYQAAKEKLDNAPEDVEAPGPISAAARASFDREYKAAGLKEVQNQLGAGNTDKALEAYQNVRDMIGDETVQVEVEYKTRFGRKKIRTETVLVRDQLDQKTGYTAE